MIRKLFNDYIMTGKNTKINNFTSPGVGDLAIYPIILQLIIIARGIMRQGTFYIWTDALRDTVLFLTLIFIWVSQIKHPLRLSRMYYLCPMSAEERSLYLKNAYLFRSLLHTVLILIMCAVLYLINGVSIWSLMYIMVCGIMYSFLSNVHDGKTEFMRAVILKPAMFISMYVQFALPASKLTKEDYIFIIGSFIFLLIIELPMFIKLVKEIDKDIKTGALSEEDYYRC
ncbi:MAG: hypothetical protein K6B44_10465 [Lachnospiraceae bacterium]|nr:hypothetical protein [Lachnospiraceae bacterium]